LNLVRSQQFSQRVAARLKRYRLANGLSQRQLGERTGLSRSAIRMIESGQRNPTLFVCHAIAVALKVPLSTVIGEAERQRIRNS
jgi:transcriptional regulator with XRE-family HTH domain